MASPATLIPERLYTLEEYLALPASNGATELVRGRVITLNPPYSWHGYVCARAAYLLTQFVDQHPLGSVLGNDSGVITGTDTLRGADVAYYSFQRVSRQDIKQRGYLSAVPEVIFEVKSPDDRWKDILARVAEYLNAGVNVVGVLGPQRNTITVYRPDHPEEIFTAEQTLTLPDVLPGFDVGVKKFFE